MFVVLNDIFETFANVPLLNYWYAANGVGVFYMPLAFEHIEMISRRGYIRVGDVLFFILLLIVFPAFLLAYTIKILIGIFSFIIQMLSEINDITLFKFKR